MKVLLLLIAVGITSAQNLEIRAGTGIPFAPSNLSGLWNEGRSLGFGFRSSVYPEEGTRFGAEWALRIDWTTFGFDTDQFLAMQGFSPDAAAMVPIAVDKSSLLGITADFLMGGRSPKSSALLGFGAGFYVLNMSDITVSDSSLSDQYHDLVIWSSETKPGWNFGVMVGYFLAPELQFEVEGRYHMIFSRKENIGFLAISLGLFAPLG